MDFTLNWNSRKAPLHVVHTKTPNVLSAQWRASASYCPCHALTITFELAKITRDLLVLVLTRAQAPVDILRLSLTRG